MRESVGKRRRGRTKAYDRAYFDRWYRDPRHRVNTPASVARKVACVVGTTEYLLGRPIRRVLDIGCGEGAWRRALARIRPTARYVGVDPSEYVVNRFRRRFDVREGRFDNIGEVGIRGRFDLVVCCDVLNYLSAAELARGLAQLAPMVSGVAFLELYSRGDGVEGDTRAWHWRPASWYRRLFGHSGFTPVGMNCYVTDELAGNVTALERASR